MIHFFTGKPGGGKTLTAVTKIIEELVRTKRDVVTNIPLRLDRLNEYLQEKYPRRVIPLVGPDARLKILDDNAEARALYREYRNAWAKAPAAEKEPIYLEFEEKIKKLGTSEETRRFWQFRNPRKLRFDDALGTLFVLDEVHLHFNARKWTETGAEGLEYLSQHRHFSDDVILVTQHADNVDVQFRRVVEDWAVIKNGYTQKIGIFRGLPMFVRKMYVNQPSGGTKQTPFETIRFRLDAKGVASCYNTAGGAGVFGKDADKNRPVSGLHPAWFMVGGVALALAVGLGISYAGKTQIKKLEKQSAPAAAVPAEAQKAAALDTGPKAPNSPRAKHLEESSQRREVPETARPLANDSSVLWVRGYVVRGNKVNVILSDGRVLTENDDELQRVRRNGIVLDGEKIHMITAKPRPEKISSPNQRIVPPEPEAKTSPTDRETSVTEENKPRLNSAIAKPSVMSAWDSVPMKRGKASSVRD